MAGCCSADRAAAGAVRRASFSVYRRQCGHRQNNGLEVAAQSQPEHEEETDSNRPQPESCHQQRAVRHRQPFNQRVERWYVRYVTLPCLL